MESLHYGYEYDQDTLVKLNIKCPEGIDVLYMVRDRRDADPVILQHIRYFQNF